MKMLAFAMSIIALFGLSYGVPLDMKSSRIHGGVNAPPGFAPHMAALLYGVTRVNVVCGASIVSTKHLLTAAHCLDFYIFNNLLSRSLHARVGSNVWHSGGTVVQFETAHMHPKWDEDTLKYDAAVLTLTEELVLSDTVAVIGLDFGWVTGQEQSYVTGWGATWPTMNDGGDVVQAEPTPDDLQLLYISTLESDQCYKAIQSNPTWAAYAPEPTPELEMCTYHSVGRGLCNGDSGSGLVSVKTGMQIGVVSWAVPCAQGAPDFYTRVSALEDFLTPILKTGVSPA